MHAAPASSALRSVSIGPGRSAQAPAREAFSLPPGPANKALGIRDIAARLRRHNLAFDEILQGDPSERCERSNCLCHRL